MAKSHTSARTGAPQSELPSTSCATRKRLGLFLGLTAFLACGSPRPTPPAAPPTTPSTVAPAPGPSALINEGTLALEASSYAEAERLFLQAESVGAKPEDLAVPLGEVYFETGRHAAAYERLAPFAGTRWTAARLLAEMSRREGELDQAIALLAPHLEHAEAHACRLLAGEIRLEQGRGTAANTLLMQLVEAYNEDAINAEHPEALALVGRAAHLLGSPEDANDAFNEAERAVTVGLQTLLWRSELFLERYDLAHAQETAAEAQRLAPHHAATLTLQARLLLESALDFDGAEALLSQSLHTNPFNPDAHAVRAGIALRDSDLETAARAVATGLKLNPKHLPLLSLRATVEFLKGPPADWHITEELVQRLNPNYSSLYTTIAEYADWEHRYTEINALMETAIEVAPEDQRARARLGLNLLRTGEQTRGVRELRRAFTLDPFNVRVFNTLNLYEKVIPKSYTSHRTDAFLFRYPKAEEPLLSRYVPELLTRARAKMADSYGFTPKTPIGIEMYTQRAHFSVRTSGLPHTAIQGVCFGQTLASLTPRNERFNLPMTLWHELAHVFHIQLSNNRVPRWFTEGLAEYETQVQRKEWRRELDPELYEALRAGRLPKIEDMTKAFTHAEDLMDVTVAYYQSTKIVEYVAERYGPGVFPQMLALWGRGLDTGQVVEQVLGLSANQLDSEFSLTLRERLRRYETQFVPSRRVGDPERVRKRALSAPNDPNALARLALLLFTLEDYAAARSTLAEALRLDPAHPQALWLSARLYLRVGKPKRAHAHARRLLDGGHDGYATQLLLAKTTDAKGAPAKVIEALRKAHAFDATQSEALSDLAVLETDPKQQRIWLERLAALEEHDGSAWRQYVKALDAHAPELIESVNSLAYADLLSAEAHLTAAQALEGAGELSAASFEYESAAMCPTSPEATEAKKQLLSFQRRHPRVRSRRPQLTTE